MIIGLFVGGGLGWLLGYFCRPKEKKFDFERMEALQKKRNI